MATSINSSREKDVGPCSLQKISRKKKHLIIKESVVLFFASRENANVVIDLILNTQEEEKGTVLAALRALCQIFSTLLDNGSMTTESKSNISKSEDTNVEQTYRLWLQQRYKGCIQCLAKLISNKDSSKSVQELALSTLMKFTEAENRQPLINKKDENSSFEGTVISYLVPNLVAKDRDMTDVIAKFQEHLEYDDLRYFLLGQLVGVLSNVVNQSLSKQQLGFLCKNTLTLLEMINIPQSDEEINNFLSKVPDLDADMRMLSIKEHKRIYSKVWLTFLRIKLPSPVYKQVLVTLHDRVMPNMINPVLLLDFLTVSYNIGGAVSILALNGLFVLITRYNLEYPEFYKKLYGLFEPLIFHVKYKARFFHLVDLFLSSTHLPSYLVAAFAKRLSRLSLIAPPHALEYIIPFVINLFLRHPSCDFLVHRTEGIIDLTSDPYIHDEPDPSKCKALESSLWEFEALQSHYHPGVASLAKKIHYPLPKYEEDLSDSLDLTIEDLMNKETQKKVRQVPLEFHPASKLFGGHDEMFSLDDWSWS